MIRTREEKVRMAEAAVVKAVVRSYKAHKTWLAGDITGLEFDSTWDARERARHAERAAVEKLLRLRGKR